MKDVIIMACRLKVETGWHGEGLSSISRYETYWFAQTFSALSWSLSEVVFVSKYSSRKRSASAPIHRINYGIRAQPYGAARAVRTLKVLVFGDGPPGEEADASIKHLKKSLHVAEAAVRELIEWSRIYGQSWLGLHGQPAKRIGSYLLGDETECADYSYGKDVLPSLEDDPVKYEFEASIDPTRARSLLSCSPTIVRACRSRKHCLPTRCTSSNLILRTVNGGF